MRKKVYHMETARSQTKKLRGSKWDCSEKIRYQQYIWSGNKFQKKQEQAAHVSHHRCEILKPAFASRLNQSNFVNQPNSFSQLSDVPQKMVNSHWN